MKAKILVLITFVFLPIIIFSQPLEKGIIRVTIDGIEDENGIMMIGLFTERDEFLVTPTFPLEYKITDEKTIVVTFENIPLGKYALSIFHDLNENKELDSNFFKIPKEPYGFSNNYMPKFGPPSFKGASFQLKTNQLEFQITLKSF